MTSFHESKRCHAGDVECRHTARNDSDLDMNLQFVHCDQWDQCTILAGDEELWAEIDLVRHCDVGLGLAGEVNKVSHIFMKIERSYECNGFG